MILFPVVYVKTVCTPLKHLRVRSGTPWIGFVATVLFLLGVMMPISPVPAQSAGQGLQVNIQSPAVRGAVRYGRWAPLDVVIRQPDAADGFSGTLEVKGANGFSTQLDVQVSAGLKRHQVTVPVFCNSQLPVFRVSLLDRSGQEIGRDQQRYSSVLNPGELVVGVSRDVAGRSMENMREELSQRTPDRVRVISAERRAVTRIGRWPGIFDLVYLTEPAELAVPVRTDLADVMSLPSAGDRIPNVQLVDQQAYDLFNPPRMSEQRRQWFGSTLTLLTVALIVGVLFCFRDPSSRWNWLILLVLPLLVLLYLTTRDPPSPPVIGQVVSVRVSDSAYRNHVVDRRVSLFPRETEGIREKQKEQKRDNGSVASSGTRSVRYPIRDLRRTIPLFHSSSAISSRFPQLEQTDTGNTFHWPEFPVGGYFVLQETESVSYEESALSIELMSEQGRVLVENQDRHPLNTVWIHYDDSFYRIGELAAEEIRNIDFDKQERVETRERFLGRAFSVDSREQRSLSRWMRYVLRRYGKGRPFVVGVQRSDRSGTEERPGAYDVHRFPGLVMHRFGEVSNR